MSDELVVRIRRLTGVLHATAFAEQIDDFIRGGLPGSSIPQGSPSANKPGPKLDADDQRWDEALTEYGRCLRDAHERLERCRILETSILVMQHMTPEQWLEYRERMKFLTAELKSPRAQNCANAHCERPVERNDVDRLRRGRCSLCYEYLRSHGSERPKRLCEKDIERELTKKAKKKQPTPMRWNDGIRFDASMPRAVSVPLNPTEKVEK